MNRVDQLDENRLVDRIHTVVETINDLRTTPQAFSSDSVITYRIFSTNAYDFRATSVGYNNRIIEVTFTPTENIKTGLGGVLRFDYDMVTSGPSSIETIVERLVPSGGISKWRLYLSGSNSFPNATVDYKFYFFANGSGTFSAALV